MAGYLLLICWSVWLGSIVLFSFVVAPALFRVLGRADAAPVMRALSPSYYMLGIVSGSVALAAALVSRPSPLVTVPLVICLVVVTYARQVVTPAADKARDAGDGERYAVLHVLSVRLNMIVLALLLLTGTVLAHVP